MRMVRAAGCALLLSAAVTTVVLAQSSPLYEITGGSTVTIAGETASEQYRASLVGGEGAPAGTASSSSHAVVMGSGDPDPVNAERVFGSGFER